MLEPLRPLEFMVAGSNHRLLGEQEGFNPSSTPTGRGVTGSGRRNDWLGPPSRVETTRWLEESRWAMGWGCLSRGREGLGSQLWRPMSGVEEWPERPNSDGFLRSQFSDLGSLGVRMGVGLPQSHHCHPLSRLTVWDLK